MHHRVTSYRRPSIAHKPHVVLWALDSQARNQSVTSHAVIEYSQSGLPVQGARVMQQFPFSEGSRTGHIVWGIYTSVHSIYYITNKCLS